MSYYYHILTSDLKLAGPR